MSTIKRVIKRCKTWNECPKCKINWHVHGVGQGVCSEKPLGCRLCGKCHNCCRCGPIEMYIDLNKRKLTNKEGMVYSRHIGKEN